MQLQPALTQQQQIQLHMTPQMLQSMNVLQMSSADLLNYLEEQAAENPFLEVAYGFDSYKQRKAGSKGQDQQREKTLLELVDPRQETLEAVLLSQLRVNGIPPEDYPLAAFLVGNLNEDGWLSITLEEAGRQLREPMEKMQRALVWVQSLEPAGVGARTLQECLAIQIGRDPNADPWAAVIVGDYLQELAEGKLRRIAENLGISVEQVEASLAYIRSLQPRPGSAYHHESQSYIEPDATVLKRNGIYVTIMNEANFPQVSLHPLYGQPHFDSGYNQEAKAFLKQYIQPAQWLIRSLEQRRLTLQRVIEAIVEEQVDFLEEGIDALKPMVLRTVAQKVELHESTVSRAVAHKYIHTPRGTFALKYFFTNGLMNSDGTLTSAAAIKVKIARLIEQESKDSPLSDQNIADKLAEQGVQVSRRTVMKYREEMNIVSSRYRRVN
ncbi:RNA polymerase factor sigma-54 [Paenibacillus naphthalenovorans]|uniref:RNA polymerase factor sigma-54 n=1 Tax=Paenibacillus naphthalenovorans TaxID=162209 RepID=UPI003D2B1784